MATGHAPDFYLFIYLGGVPGGCSLSIALGTENRTGSNAQELKMEKQLIFIYIFLYISFPEMTMNGADYYCCTEECQSFLYGDVVK